jgi:amidase
VTRSPWSFATATELSDALARKKVSAVELAEHAIARIERHDGKINAICVRDFDRALDAARAADAALARGESRPLLGIPLTVKESFNVAGLPTTWGIPAHKDYRPKEDALAITRIKDAGGVILGKTNVPLGLGDWQSYNDIYGTTDNPYDLSRTPGGSSGGSSAALAAGYGALSLGTDLAGSLRVPAFTAASSPTNRRRGLCLSVATHRRHSHPRHTIAIWAGSGPWREALLTFRFCSTSSRGQIRWRPARLTSCRCRRRDMMR